MRKSYEFQRIYYSFMSLYKRYEATKNRAVAISKRHDYVASKNEEPFDWIKPLLTENNYFFNETIIRVLEQTIFSISKISPSILYALMRSIFLLFALDDNIQNSHLLERWPLGWMVFFVSHTFVSDCVLMILSDCVCFHPVREAAIGCNCLAH